MTTYDWSMLALIVGVAIFSGWRGILWQIANVGSFVVGGMLVCLYGQTATQLIPLAPPLNKIVATAGLYVAGVILTFFAASTVRRAVHSLGLGGADHHLGFVFGAFEGLFLALAFTFVLCNVAPERRSAVSESHAAAATRYITQHYAPWLPGRYQRTTGSLVSQLRRYMATQNLNDWSL